MTDATAWSAYLESVPYTALQSELARRDEARKERNRANQARWRMRHPIDERLNQATKRRKMRLRLAKLRAAS